MCHGEVAVRRRRTKLDETAVELAVSLSMDMKSLGIELVVGDVISREGEKQDGRCEHQKFHDAASFCCHPLSGAAYV
jgi:hypothetical protein